MNQNVLFNDDIHWHQQSQSVSFTAQCGGGLISCYLKDSYLRKLGVNGITNDEKVSQCQLMQFDIEDDVQQAIEDECFNELNELWLD